MIFIGPLSRRVFIESETSNDIAPFKAHKKQDICENKTKKSREYPGARELIKRLLLPSSSEASANSALRFLRESNGHRLHLTLVAEEGNSPAGLIIPYFKLLLLLYRSTPQYILAY